MRKQTKMCDISQNVKNVVYSRDNGHCILCGKFGIPNAHYIARSQGGLGIEKNIVCLCAECHRDYDQSIQRKFLKEKIKEYLKSVYEDWNENDLIYKKNDNY